MSLRFRLHDLRLFVTHVRLHVVRCVSLYCMPATYSMPEAKPTMPPILLRSHPILYLIFVCVGFTFYGTLILTKSLSGTRLLEQQQKYLDIWMFEPPISSSWNNRPAVLSNETWIEESSRYHPTEIKRNVTQQNAILDTPSLSSSKQNLLNDMTDEMMY
jgi:hypothetical protein